MKTATKTSWAFNRKRLRDLRELKGKSLDEIGAMVARSGMTILNWETGKSSPAVEDLVNIANALDIDPTSFFLFVEET